MQSLMNVRNVASRYARWHGGSSCLGKRPHLDHAVRYRTGGLRYQIYGIGQGCSLNHREPGYGQRTGHERASLCLNTLRVSISYLHRATRNTHQDAGFKQPRIMGVRSVANGSVGAVVPLAVPVSDGYKFRHVESPVKV